LLATSSWDAWIVVFPAAEAVKFPIEPILPTPWSVLFQETLAVTSSTAPSLYVPRAVNCKVSLTLIDEESALMFKETIVAATKIASATC
jgi:hypothetical protein